MRSERRCKGVAILPRINLYAHTLTKTVINLQADHLASEADAVEEQLSRESRVASGQIVRIMSLSTLDVFADSTVRVL